MRGKRRCEPIIAEEIEKLFFCVYILLSKHERRLGEFEKIMQTRHAVEVSHNFQEISQPFRAYLSIPLQ